AGQNMLQERILKTGIVTGKTFKAPAILRLGFIRDFLARLIAFGVRPEHIRLGAAARPRAHAAVLGAARFFNPLVLSLAGTRFLPLYGVIEHHGRRSGKVYRTPVVVQPTSDGFIVP